MQPWDEYWGTLLQVMIPVVGMVLIALLVCWIVDRWL